MKNIKTLLKYVLSVGTIVVLFVIYRTVPLTGAESLDGLTRFNIVAAVLGAIGLVFSIYSIRQWRKLGDSLTVVDKGANGILIAVALIVLEFGLLGQFGGVMMDKNSGPVTASMKNCHVKETSFVNHLRGFDAVLICTDPSGDETIFMVNEEIAQDIGDGSKDLTVEYYKMTNRLVRYY